MGEMDAKSFPLAILVPVPTTHWDGELAADIFVPEGTAWLAVFDGDAEPRDYSLGGYTIMLTAADGTQAYYAHGFPNRVSGRVRAGQVIGYTDRSGNAATTPPHLHFAVGVINNNGGGTVRPSDWLAGVGIPPPPPPPPPGPGVNVVALMGLFMVSAGVVVALRGFGGAGGALAVLVAAPFIPP